MNTFKVGSVLRGVVRNIENYINQELAAINISKGQFEYFVMIHRNEGINQKDLAELMNVGKASVTKALKKLIEEGLVYRTVNENDHRNYGLYVSEKGQPYVDKFRDISTKVNDTMFRNFTEYEMRALIHLIDKMDENSKKFIDM